MFNLFIMKHIIFNDPYNKKKVVSEIDNENQLLMIEILYKKININNESNNESNNEIINNELKKDEITFEREIKKKLNSYKNQDKQKNKYDSEKIITYNEIIQKLYESKLKCYYCNCDMVILFNKKREGCQWTLERFDNNIGHYETNTCISCLKCNLQRRTDNYEYFKNGKQLKINIIK
jgi:hypothetical protein